MKRAIVFGGGGFIGNALVKVLLKHDVETYAVVRPGFFEGPEAFRLEEVDVPIVECDLRDLNSLPQCIPWKAADVFYQVAWEGLSGQEILDYRLQVQNIKWMMDSIVTAARFNCNKFIGAGTISQDELYTREGRAYQGDRHRIFRCAAQMCELTGPSVALEHQIDFIWPIISNVYGEGELEPRLINSLIRKLQFGEKMPLSDADQLYDFIYLSDAAEALYLIGEKGCVGHRYNISSGHACPLKQYLLAVRDVVAPGTELLFGLKASAGIQLCAESFDITALKEDTGFSPKVSFRDGISRTAEWIRKVAIQERENEKSV